MTVVQMPPTYLWPIELIHPYSSYKWIQKIVIARKSLENSMKLECIPQALVVHEQSGSITGCTCLNTTSD